MKYEVWAPAQPNRHAELDSASLGKLLNREFLIESFLKILAPEVHPSFGGESRRHAASRGV